MSCLKFILSLVLLTCTALGVSCGSDPEAVASPEAIAPQAPGKISAGAPARTALPTRGVGAPARDLEALFQQEEKRRRAQAEWLESLRKASEKNKKQGEVK